MSESSSLDSQVLLAHVLKRPRAWVLAHPEAALTDEQLANLNSALARLESSEPLPYILGHWEFYGLDFAVSPDALIPRPETELLVDRAIVWLQTHPSRRVVADIGAGTGCIAVALAAHIPDVDILATDISHPALILARQNTVRHAVEERVSLIRADLLPPVAVKPDLICANLPYIPTAVLPSLPVHAREPGLALDGGQTGLTQIERFLQNAPRCLAPGGLLLLEIEATQGETARRMAQSAFPQSTVDVLIDLAGRDRVIQIKVPDPNHPAA